MPWAAGEHESIAAPMLRSTGRKNELLNIPEKCQHVKWVRQRDAREGKHHSGFSSQFMRKKTGQNRLRYVFDESNGVEIKCPL